MDQSADYKLKKLEKGPLQRFKNQNAILKRFGDPGLSVYKAITGKRTSQELCRDLGMEADKFTEILDYLNQAGMVELELASGGSRKEKESRRETATGQPAEPEELKAESETGNAEPETGIGPEPAESSPSKSARRRRSFEETEEGPEQKSEDEITPLEVDSEPPESEKITDESEREQDSTNDSDDEIKPIEIDEPPSRKTKRKSEGEFEIEPESGSEPQKDHESSESEPPSEPSDENPPEELEETKLETKEDEKEDEITPLDNEAPDDSGSANMSPVEKIIFDKYGDIGLRVYTLIDGQRTAEEIMHETGLTEAQLVEMLDFMDEQGIIKLDYPKNQQATSRVGPSSAGPSVSEKTESGFIPMVEAEDSTESAGPGDSPLEIPVKAPSDIVKSVQSKAKMMLKYGEKGSKVSELIDGKNDVLDITLKTKLTLPNVLEMTRFMMENGMLIMKPMPRVDVHKKYGDDGYAVYKKYGKEGLLLYELIGKELTIRQMADKVTTQREKIIDMFVFIHEVLGIELPIDKNALSQQLGL